eukprot:jgi/Mesen1/1927/ME000146S01010
MLRQLCLPVTAQHGKDESYHTPVPPEVVVFPETTQEVSQVVRACVTHRVPLVPFGAGTSLEGHVAALHGGVCVDLSKMSRIVEVSEGDMDCRVEAGVTRQQLNEHLRDTGLFFSVDPGAKYGTMREVVMGVTAVLADGAVVRTGTRARKSSSGYDLTKLLVGSEGTLGIITEVALRLFGQPEAVSAGVCAFTSLKGAVDTAMTTIQMGIPVARIELLDEVQVDAVNKYSKTALALQPTLFFEFHGSSAASVQQQALQVGSIAQENGGGHFDWSDSAEERSRLWAARHSAYYAARALRPDCNGFITDVCVPISRLSESILAAKADILHSKLVAPIVGHVGDGNFHILLIVDPNNEEEVTAAKQLNARLVERALAAGGTCSGEHGVGYGKLEFLEREHGEVALHVMAAVKHALDPHNILNPGKLGSRFPFAPAPS